MAAIARAARCLAPALVAGLTLVCVIFTASTSASAAPKDVAGLAAYAGADRTQVLIEGAKREGELTFYSSMQIDSITPLQKAFEAKYGVKLRIWRGAGKDILQRVVSEAAAGRHDVDIVESDSFALEALSREDLLQPVKSPYLADLVPEALRPQGQWVGTRLNIVVGVYNTALVPKDSLPKSYEDLRSPAFRGKLGMEVDDYDWFGMVVGLLGEEKGLTLFRDIVHSNGISVRKGHTLLTNLVAAGEVPIGLTVFLQNVRVAAKAGAPVDWFLLPPTIARPDAMGFAKYATHPYAALLFYDFMLSDGQSIMLGREFMPTSRKIPSMLDRIPVNFVAPDLVLDQGQKWQKLYADVLSGK
ncbi:MAG TPA: extracellular solute-binding protein [Xanthobacteraceae bacterium]|nr:extracellular solute-binding protein [Xanthobacteraceae bacterium]